MTISEELEDLEVPLTDAENDELAALLHEIADAPEATITTEVEEASIDLNVLLAESMGEVERKAEVLRAKAKLRKGLATGEERRALQAIVEKWELVKVWNIVGMDVLFQVQKCSCGSVHHHFLGFFQRQQHKEGNIQRWVAEAEASHTTKELPKGVKEEVEEVPVCIKCAVRKGWGVTI